MWNEYKKSGFDPDIVLLRIKNREVKNTEEYVPLEKV